MASVAKQDSIVKLKADVQADASKVKFDSPFVAADAAPELRSCQAVRETTDGNGVMFYCNVTRKEFLVSYDSIADRDAALIQPVPPVG